MITVLRRLLRPSRTAAHRPPTSWPRGTEPAEWTAEELREIRTQADEQPKPEPCPTCGRKPGPLNLFTREEQTRVS